MATTSFALVRSLRLVWFLALVLLCGIGGAETAAAAAEEPVGKSAPANLTGIGTSMPVPQLPSGSSEGSASVQNATPPLETVPLTTEVVEYYGYDAIGSVRVVFDTAGTVVGRSEFLAFGDEWLTSSNMPPERFTGQARDAEAGFDYFNARMYQPRAGRFGRVDPVFGGLGNPQRWNRYAYALNNPLGYTDPTGLNSTENVTFGGSGIVDFVLVTGTMPPTAPLAFDLFGLENAGGVGGSSDLGDCSVPIMLPGGCDGGGKLRAGGDFSIMALEPPPIPLPEVPPPPNVEVLKIDPSEVKMAGVPNLSGAATAVAVAATRVAQSPFFQNGLGKVQKALEAEAKLLYPKLADKIQLHHVFPRYLGGAIDGIKVPLNAAYHQLITNAFRVQWQYGYGPPDPARAAEIMKNVYSKYPLP